MGTARGSDGPEPTAGTGRSGDAGTSQRPVPRSGDVLQVTEAASVQFRDPIRFRVIRVHDWPTYTGWVWLDGYQLNNAGEAVERRSIFVQAAGLRREGPSPHRDQRSGRSRPRTPGPGPAGTG